MENKVRFKLHKVKKHWITIVVFKFGYRGFTDWPRASRSR
ncbi:MAG: KxYKxGKxW signal peptide domain-containing protein [Streptococcus sp.]